MRSRVEVMRVTAVVFMFIASCAHNVPQDKATSADGKIKGAKPLMLENGEAIDSGIVTYPGGDRVDWKMVELPAKQHGTLDIKLAWTTPRPGLKLAFDVFDAWNARIATSKRQGTARNRLATIDNAKGKYFIRVYAVGRGDAGRYKLGVEFKEQASPHGGTDWPSVPIPDPPRLADLPTVTVVTPCDVFDPKNPDCRDKCPAGAPARWPGCIDVCTAVPPDPAIPACAKAMACPPGGDIRVTSCKPDDFRPCPDPKHPDPTNLNCLNFQYPPVATRIAKKMVIGNEVEITIMAGTQSNIEPGWTAVILQGTTNKPLAGGSIKIMRVDESMTIGRVSLTPQQVEENKRVLFSPPPKPPKPPRP